MGTYPRTATNQEETQPGAVMRRFVKWLLILVVLLGVPAGATVWAISWWQRHSVPKYLTATVSRGRVETIVNSTGTVKPVRVVSVGAFTSGPIAEVKVNYNSVVKKKDLLALIDRRLLAAIVDHDRGLPSKCSRPIRTGSKHSSSRPATTKTALASSWRSTRITSPKQTWTITTSRGSPVSVNSNWPWPTSNRPRPRWRTRGQP